MWIRDDHKAKTARHRRCAYHADPEYRPRLEGGIDFGIESRILIRFGDRRLVWQRGHTAYISRASYNGTYIQSELQVDIVNTYETRFSLGKTVFEGGRLSKARIAEHIERIRELLELPDLQPEDIDTKRTLVIGCL